MGECLITRRGGETLNFKVVGGTVQPSDPKENTIWVNTATEITSWDFSASEVHRRSGNKNLIVYPYYHTSRTANGVEFTDNGDGTITVNGTASSGADAYFVIAAEGIPQKEFILTPGTYTLSGGVGDDTTNKCSLSVYTSADDWATTSGRYRASETPRTFTIDQTVKARAFIQVYGGTTIVNQVFRPQLEKGSAATSFIKGDATGQAWIKTADNGLRQFNALKKNGVILRPTSAKQYLNGAWTSKPVKLYQNGAWQELAQYLYRTGDTGTGFVAKSWKFYSGGSGMTPSITYGTDGVVFKATAGQGYGGVVYFPNQIDLTSYNTLTANATLGGTINPDSMPEGLYVWGSIGSDSGYGSSYTARALFNGTGTKTLSVDVSGLSGKYYVGFGLRGESTSGTYEYIELMEAKLE